MNNSLRARVIAEWRGMPERPFPEDTSQPVSTVVGKLMQKLGLSSALNEDEVMGAWQEIVGDFVSQHARPQRLFEGVLYVQVLHAPMHYELDRTWRPEIVRKLKARFGKVVRDVRFRVG